MNRKLNLDDLGWNQELQSEYNDLSKLYDVSRVAAEYKGLYKLITTDGEVFGTISGKLNHEAVLREDYPAVGDWVLIDKLKLSEDRAVIRGILKRKSKFSRKAAGDTADEQIIAVNIDILFICMALNHNFNLRRLERYITMAWDSGAVPVVVLTKADLCEDIEDKLNQTKETALGLDVYYVSCLNGTGLDEIRKFVGPGRTFAFIGSSGVGKSTIINELLGENIIATGDVSEGNDKGKHTTTNRSLYILPGGGVVIDTPGMREFHLLDSEESVDAAFDDIESLALKCKFSDCTHTGEPCCAVVAAIKSGELSQKRFDNFVKLKREALFMERKMNKRSEIIEKRSVKNTSKKRNENIKF